VRVELFGPSGAGKTTILAAAATTRTAREWLGPTDIAALVKESSPSHELRAAFDAPELRQFVNWYFTTLSTYNIEPSQKIETLRFLQKSCFDTAQVSQMGLDETIVHDELLLHRSCSLLPHALRLVDDTMTYFDLVPVPEAAVVVTASPSIVLERIRGRDRIPNVYSHLNDDELLEVLSKTNQMCDIAAEVLRSRGVRVLSLDSSVEPEANASRLELFVRTAARPTGDAGLKERLLLASGSFRKKAGRHNLRRQGVMYCAFSTPKFTVRPEESQRDAAKRLAAFGLDQSCVSGKTVLDLGSNTGAMLFQLSNHDLARGVGIEYDVDKVGLANEIALLAEVPNITFKQGDIDKLDPTEIGVYDIVLALAIEAHVQDPHRLYELLGSVTSDMLCFEGNTGCDMKEVTERLSANGFTEFTDLGFCTDDVDPRNNQRPQLLARKPRPSATRVGDT
jgi:2-polyprenyl-3-methyl-5-hydroxy-6-metoxy-1,4-benzoquinol methylase